MSGRISAVLDSKSRAHGKAGAGGPVARSEFGDVEGELSGPFFADELPEQPDLL